MKLAFFISQPYFPSLILPVYIHLKTRLTALAWTCIRLRSSMIVPTSGELSGALYMVHKTAEKLAKTILWPITVTLDISSEQSQPNSSRYCMYKFLPSLTARSQTKTSLLQMVWLVKGSVYPFSSWTCHDRLVLANCNRGRRATSECPPCCTARVRRLCQVVAATVGLWESWPLVLPLRVLETLLVEEDLRGSL